MFQLKRLTQGAIPAALEKAERYRLLNEPSEAESICRDILEVEPENQQALRTLFLALTDQFRRHLAPAVTEARAILERFEEGYHRTYYEGILWERRAKACLRKSGPHNGHIAYESLHRAMECFESAAEQRPAGNDDALLRWNTCVRLLEANPKLVPAPQEAVHHQLE